MSDFPATQSPQTTPIAPRRKKRRKAALRTPDRRRAEARLLQRAEAERAELAGGSPSDLQRRWISMASGLAVHMHMLTRQACSVDLVPPAHAAAYAAASKQYTALVDRIVRGAPDRRHERIERPEAPELGD